MYKDPEKQKKAVLKAVHKHRGVIPCNTQPEKSVTPVIPCGDYVKPVSRARVTRDYTLEEAEVILPVELKAQIEHICIYRNALGLFDDREDRYVRAAKYRELYPKR